MTTSWTLPNTICEENGYNKWEYERVIQFPGDDDIWGTKQSYRLEFKNMSGDDVPLCIYINREADGDYYPLENNLMDTQGVLHKEYTKNITTFVAYTKMYMVDVLLDWIEDKKITT